MFVSFSLKFWQFPFMMSICFFLQQFFEKKMLMPQNPESSIEQSFSLLFAIIFHLVSLWINRKEKKVKEIKVKTKSLRFNQSQNKKLIMLYSLLGLLTAINNIFSTYLFVLQAMNTLSLTALFGMIYTWIGFFILFKKQLYRHHILALTIFLIIQIYTVYENKATLLLVMTINMGSVNDFIIVFIIYILSVSAKEVLEHYLMRVCFQSPSIVLIHEGWISLVVYAIYMFIMNWIPCGARGISTDYFQSLCEQSKWDRLLLSFTLSFTYLPYFTGLVCGFIIFCFLMNYFRIQTNYKLTPMHRYIAEVMAILFWYIYYVSINFESQLADIVNFIIVIVLFIVLILCCCIFNEYLIIRLCGLEKNTFVEIDKRAKEEELILEMKDLKYFDSETGI